MRAREVRRSRRPLDRGGITLLELVMALTILALAVAVAVPAFLTLGEEDVEGRTVRRIQTLFRLARDSAIGSGRPVTVVIDSVSQLVWLDIPPRIRLGSSDTFPSRSSLFRGTEAGEGNLGWLGGEAALEALKPGEPLELPAGVRMEVPRARARFTFQPTGASLADTLLVVGPFGTLVVTLDPWTGDVRVRK